MPAERIPCKQCQKMTNLNRYELCKECKRNVKCAVCGGPVEKQTNSRCWKCNRSNTRSLSRNAQGITIY